MFNRPKFLKPKSEKPHKIFDDTLACLGKNALTVEHKTCRDKIRSQLKNLILNLRNLILNHLIFSNQVTVHIFLVYILFA